MRSGRLLVTGAEGFVGRHLVSRARERGLSVAAAGGDLRQPEAVRRAVAEAQPDGVVHLARARPDAPGEALAALADDARMAANLRETLAELAPEARVLAPGTAAQYGMGSRDRLPESAPLSPVSAYGASRCALEAAWLEGGATGVVWARTFNLLGPGQAAGAPVADWALATAAAEAGGTRTIRTGPLDRVRDLLDVRDAADAYLDLLASSAEGPVNVCSGRACVLGEVAEALQGLATVGLEFAPGAAAGASPLHVVGDPSRLLELAGFEPGIDLEQSLADSLADARRRVIGEGAPLAAAGRA